MKETLIKDRSGVGVDDMRKGKQKEGGDENRVGSDGSSDTIEKGEQKAMESGRSSVGSGGNGPENEDEEDLTLGHW